MLNKEKNFKQYFSISEVAERFSVTETLLRFWEKEFPDIIHPKRAGRGIRLYNEKDISNIAKVFHLVKERGMTLDGARKTLSQQRGVIDPKMQMLDTLKSIRNQLQAINHELGDL